MSHGAGLISRNDVPDIIRAKPFTLPNTMRLVLMLFVLIGIAGAGWGFTQGDTLHTWTSLQVNFLFWLCLAAASTCFSAALHICNAQWSRPIRRLFESGSNFFLITPVFLIILYLGHHHMFIWAREPIPGKGSWLTSEFVYIRDILALVLLIYLARRVVFFGLRRDFLAIRGGLSGLPKDDVARWNDKHYDRYVAGAKGDALSEIQLTTDRMGRLSPVVIFFYALVISLIAWDQEMSVDPHWYSTMFGGFVFMGAVYLAMAWCSMTVGVARILHPLFRAKVTRATLHDLGKLLFGFGIFWAYLFWSHYLPIWYGNIPEETGWIVLRLRKEPWHSLAWFVLGSCFIVPFLLGLSRDVKQVPQLLFCTGVIVAIGLWTQHYLLFAPTIFPDHIPIGIIDIAITLGYMGIYILCAGSFLERVPLMPFGDLYQKPIQQY